MKTDIGKIAWVDLTVKCADEIKEFYSKVVGWRTETISMGEYDDYNMLQMEGGDPVSGICHATGVNEGLPSQWLIYILVANLDNSISQCKENGGAVLFGPRNISKNSKYAIIKDPAGAVAALYEEN